MSFLSHRLSVPVLAITAALLSSALIGIPTASPARAVGGPTIVDTPAYPNADVRQVAVTADGTTYAVGGFSQAGPSTGGLALLDTDTASVERTFPSVVGSIAAISDDGAGGWYIGGNFTAVGGVARTNLAHINADFSVDAAWDPAPNNQVRTLTVIGGTVYVGGDFTSVDGTGRNYIAVIDASGALLPWNPGANSTVYALASDDSAVYVGGSYTTIAGTSRSRVAAFDPANGSLLPWNPGANNTVWALETANTLVYLGGEFTTAGGQSRNRVAAIASVATGDDTATPFNPNINSTVRTIALDDTTLYVGGDFTKVNGTSVSRNRAAAFDTTTISTATAWNPNSDGSVYVVEPTASGVYLGGFFNAVGGVSRSGLVHTDPATGAVQSWDAGLARNTAVSAVRTVGTAGVVIGGGFNHVNLVSRKGGAAFDSSGLLTDWDPQLNGIVTTMEIVGDTAYVSGYFTQAGATARNHAAAVDLVTGAPTAWNPNLDYYAQDMAIVGSTAYLVGEFNTVGGVTRHKAAAVRIDDTGTLTDWNPDLNLGGRSVAIADGVAYLGGYFTTVGGVTRNRVAGVAIDDTGTLMSWNPNANNSVEVVVLDGDTAYLGGSFTSIGGTTRRLAAQVSITDAGTLTSWNPDVDCPPCSAFYMQDPYVQTILLDGDTAYLGGYFDNVGSYGGFSSLAVVSASGTGAVDTSWKPTFGASGFVPTMNSLAVDGASLRVGGYFPYVETWSTPVLGTVTMPARAPSAPTAVTGTAANASADISWTVASDGRSAITRVEFALDDTSVVDDSTTSTSSPHTLTGLTNGQPYTVYVRLVNAVGTGPWSTASNAFTPVAPAPPAPPPAPIAPGAPRDVVAVAGDATASVTWSAPSTEGSFPVTNYRVTANPGGRTCLTATLTCEIDGLTNGTTYTFSVSALSGAGWGASARSNAVTPAPAPEPEPTTILITGARAPENSRIVRVHGEVTGTLVDTVQPYYRIGGRRGERSAQRAVSVREDGTFTWQRRTSRRISIRVIAGDVSSNTVTVRGR